MSAPVGVDRGCTLILLACTGTVPYGMPCAISCLRTSSAGSSAAAAGAVTGTANGDIGRLRRLIEANGTSCASAKSSDGCRRPRYTLELDGFSPRCATSGHGSLRAKCGPSGIAEGEWPHPAQRFEKLPADGS